MKFGKQIQSQQIPGWTEYYLDYKFLKKIINSLAANRPASEVAALAAGIRPPPPPSLLNGTSAASRSESYFNGRGGNPTSTATSADGAGHSSPDPMDDEPLPPSAQPPTPGFGSRGGSTGKVQSFMSAGAALADFGGSGPPTLELNGSGVKENETLVAHRTVFFFKLEREMEKINVFYLQKERDLRLRLLTLLSNRKRILGSLRPGNGASADLKLNNGPKSSVVRVEWKALEEGWKVLERDLGKLQQFIEINAVGFRKILKKWDKRSKSNTKELYLSRQVEVQPCFNREFLAKLSDIIAANLLDLENGADSLQGEVDKELLDDTLDHPVEFEADTYDSLDALAEVETSLSEGLQARELHGTLEAFRRALEDTARLHQDQHAEVDRILWKAVLELPAAFVGDVLQLVGGQIQWDRLDGINGRTKLHQAALAGLLPLVKACIQREIAVGDKDAYGRTALHYATSGGYPEIASILLGVGADPAQVDMDGNTPLLLAITEGRISCVRILLDYSSTSAATIIEPLMSVSNDLIPLSLACQYGHEEVARLLLRKGAKVIPNSEGLYPQHLAAREGHPAICRLLVAEGGPAAGGKDREDKYNQWTPLFHAVLGDRPSHVECVRILVEAGVDVNAMDEYGKTALFYAAYYGHIEAVNILYEAGSDVAANKIQFAAKAKSPLSLAVSSLDMKGSPASDLDLDDNMDDLIPSLSLPPPIVPLQVFGHNYLDKRCLVQLSLGRPFSRKVSASGAPVPAVKLYGATEERINKDNWSSVKLVMTSKPDITSMPHSVILPLVDERETFDFQVSADNLPQFSIDFSIYPTFGSKVIGKAVVLFSSFDHVNSHQTFVAPLLDHQLKTIGEVAFELSVVRPFVGVQLEIGGKVETYWKSTTVPTFSGLSQDHGRRFKPHRPLSVASSSPRVGGAASGGGGPATPLAPPHVENGLITSTSLSGQYINLVVQVTRDLVPVVYLGWALPVDGFQLGVTDVDFIQFDQLAKRRGADIDTLISGVDSSSPAADWYRIIASSMAPLERVLALLPNTLGVNLECRYTTPHDARRLSFNNNVDGNDFVDSVLRVVYEAGNSATSPTRNRKIVFSAFDPTVASFLNFKQPNYAVFFGSFCGLARSRRSSPATLASASSSSSSLSSRLEPIELAEEDDKRCLSVREAVKFAKANNLLGVMLDATLIAQVPHLIYSIKESGLILAVFGGTDEDKALGKIIARGCCGKGPPSIEGLPSVDACMSNGVISYSF